MRYWSAATWLILSTMAASAPADDEAGLEFFEKEVRPLLAARCYECHSSKSKEPKGSLRVDSLAALIQGGDTGPAIVPGMPKESLLIDAVNYGELYQMPPKSKLPAEEIAVLTKWVEMGAPWPKENPVAASGDRGSEFDLARRKAEHWCWQPLQRPETPSLRPPPSAIHNPIDAFVLAKLESKGLALSPPADKRTLIRRAYFDLIGLPPTPKEVDAFLSDDSPQAFDTVVNRLLDSPHFGERWGRHWLDLVRYAESRGHEFDYNIPNAFEYRDYVIRALNADVPYDQFVTEHIAGDLLPEPRLHPTEGWNESILATGFWFLGEWIHSPVDIRKDECDRVDNQLDVFSKTFMGLTVTCARCHDHKFDAISQRDYYALAGYLNGSSYRLTRFQTAARERSVAEELGRLNAKYGAQLAASIIKELQPRTAELAAALAAEAGKLKDELGVEETAIGDAEVIVDFGAREQTDWRVDGPTFGAGPVRCGELVLTTTGTMPIEVAVASAARRDPAWNALAAAPTSENDAGRLSGWMRAGRTLKTPTWTLKSGQVHYLIEGAGHVYGAVDSHAMVNGPLHGELARDTGGDSNLPTRWVSHDLSRYSGHRVHLEFSPKGDEDFRVLKIVEGPRPPAPARRPNRLVERLAAVAKADSETAAAQAKELIATTAEQLAAGRIIADQDSQDRAALANWLLARCAAKGLPEPVSNLTVQWKADRDRVLAQLRPESRLAMAMWEGTPVDENLLIRGNHKTVGPVVPRRMLEALASGGRQPPEAIEPSAGGRLDLARSLVDPANPFTSRVMVNRIWHHLLGRGIVPSVDNFGVLGQEPTHPELLDYLATQFIDDGWSVKRMIRRIMLSATYQQASTMASIPLPSGGGGSRSEPGEGRKADDLDPQNQLFHRQNIKRLEGEAIRDSILAISGRLDRTQFGPSVPVHLTPFMQGRGRPGDVGPLDGNGRRSIYISIRRNFLSPMMLAFDTPIPFSTVGRRNVSNVPAQALILMNDPFVVEQARVWAKKLLAEGNTSPDSRIRRMYLEAFSRGPTAEEAAAALAFLNEQAAEYGIAADVIAGDQRVWADFAHVLWNVKSFTLVE